MHSSKSLDAVQSLFYGSMPLFMAFFKNKKNVKALFRLLYIYVYIDT